ncbi:MAG TPA: Beta-galactosidase C-terminal domain, partial [Spirochaetia bacterium]|nr:Beta-galactosidase C-terminal domain [Spirochaetia bacterium]
PQGVEATRRRKGSDSFLFLLNHNAAAARVDLGPGGVTELATGKTLKGSVEIPARGVLILKE